MSASIGPAGKLTIKPSGEPVAKIGPIAHIGLAVKNCDEAARLYSRLFGIEFAVDDYDMSTGKYFNVEGKPSKARFRAAFGQAGSVAIELVEVLEGETPHTKFLREHGEGMQHLCFYVDNMQETMERMKAEGFRPILDYEFETVYDGKRSRIQEVYLNTNEHLGGTTIQLLQVDSLD
jgi:methylmalonyl-CoA/ethylmalonyl-CoA epimerase